MPTSTNVTNLKINELTEAQYDTAVSGGVISVTSPTLQNTATGTGSLSIGGGVASGNYSLVLSGNWTGAGSSSANQTTNINTDSTQTQANLLIGRMNNNLPFGCIFLNGSTNRPSSGIAAGEFWVSVSNGTPTLSWVAE